MQPAVPGMLSGRADPCSIDADNAQPAVIEALRAEVAALTAVTAGSPRTALCSSRPPTRYDAATDPPDPTFRQRFCTATLGDDRPASRDLRPSIPQSGGPILAS